MLKNKKKNKSLTPRILTSLLGVLVVSMMSVNTFAKTPNADAADTLLSSILAAQPDKTKARYPFRKPAHTLDFLQIKPGMKVLEVLPGNSGWYSKLLVPYLGNSGELVGVDYAVDMWPHFSFMTPERLEKKKAWVSTWTDNAQKWRDESSATVSAFQFSQMPEEMKGTADAVLFIRAFHHLARLQDKGPYLDSALKESYAALKPGGLVGVVQHEAREDRSDKWADGNKGYLKKSFVIKTMTDHGFELIGQSSINENPNDQASEGDKVWRLPPSLRGNDDKPELKQLYSEIGESNRMTLLFKKPSA